MVAKSTGTVSEFSLDDRVFHQKFGYGQVVKIDGNKLTIAFEKAGEKKEAAEGEGKEVLYRGIAARSFERRFQLADHVEVRGATLENGLLHVDLVREIPEAMKPRTIAINGGKARKPVEKQVEAKVAA